MSKEILASPEPHIQELAQLANHPIAKQIYRSHNAIHTVQPTKARDLDIAFLSKDTPQRPITSLPIFGLNCAGVVGVRGRHQLESTERRLRENPNVSPLFDAGADIAILTRPDIRNWTAFFDQILEEGWLEKFGTKILDYSGLERVSFSYHYGLLEATLKIVEENMPYLWKYKAGETDYTDSLDLAFLSKDKNDVRLVPLAHIREPWMEEGSHILGETIHSSPKLTPGIIIPRPFENKIEAYQRAIAAQQEYQNKYPDKDICVPVAYSGQISLWRKLGFTQELAPNLEEASVTPEEIIRFLFLGDHNLNQGELSRMGYSLPGNIESMIGGLDNSRSVFAGADIVFFSKNEYGQRQLTTLNWPVWGIDLNARKKTEKNIQAKWDNGKMDLELEIQTFEEQFKVKPIYKVGGIIIMPDDWSVDQMHGHAKSIQKIFEYHGGDPTSYLLYVNSQLFEYWKYRGSIFVPEEELKESLDDSTSKTVQSMDTKTRAEYGLGISSSNTTLVYSRLQPHAMVGGTIDMIAEVSEDGDKEAHVLNLGAYFGAFSPRSQTGITGKPSTALGIKPLLSNGEIPMISGLWDPEYLIKSAIDNPSILKRNGDPVDSFIRSEISSYYSEEELEFILGVKPAKQILRLANKDHQIWQPEKWVISHWLNQHPHADHHQNSAFMHRDIPTILRTESYAILSALTSQNATWQEKFTYVSLLAQPKEGARYQRVPRKFHQIHWSSQKVQLSPNLIYSAPLINHSIPGSAMQIINTPNGTFINSGDIRPGLLSEKTLTEYENQANVLVLESTNPPFTKKASSGITEAEVTGNLARVFQQNQDKIIVVAAPKNHPVRLQGIIEAAKASGREVAISNKHAGIINQLVLAKGTLAPKDAEGFGYFLPHVGEDVGLWLRKREREQAYIKALRKVASEGRLGVVDHHTISEDGDKWVVVIDPWEKLQYNFGDTVLHDKGLAFVWSSYYVYDWSAKAEAAGNVKWLNTQAQKFSKAAFPYYADFSVFGNRVERRPTHPSIGGLHASGHGDFNFMVDVASTLLPNNTGTIVVVHGENTDTYAKSLRSHLNQRQIMVEETAKQIRKVIGPDNPSRLKIYSRLKPYDPVHPINYNTLLGINAFELPIQA